MNLLKLPLLVIGTITFICTSVRITLFTLVVVIITNIITTISTIIICIACMNVLCLTILIFIQICFQLTFFVLHNMAFLLINLRIIITVSITICKNTGLCILIVVVLLHTKSFIQVKSATCGVKLLSKHYRSKYQDTLQGAISCRGQDSRVQVQCKFTIKRLKNSTFFGNVLLALYVFGDLKRTFHFCCHETKVTNNVNISSIQRETPTSFFTFRVC